MRSDRALILCLLLAGPAAAAEMRGAEALSAAPTIPEQLTLPLAQMPDGVATVGVPAAMMPGAEIAALPVAPALSAGVSEVVPEKLKSATPASVALMGVSPMSVSGGLAPQPPEDAASAGSSLFDGGGPNPAGPRIVSRTVSEKINDRYHFRRLWLENMHWYLVTHIQGMWPKYHAKIIVAQARGATLPVSSHRRFFSYMRVMGQTGKFYVLGFAPRDDKSVLKEARETFKKYFNNLEVGPDEESAFERFLDRATTYNAAKRNNTNLRKHVRDAMLQAAVMPVEQMAEYFDGLLREDASKQTDDFQTGGGQQKTLEAFRKAVLDTIAEEDPQAKDRVVGVVLLGSFASGGATRHSDLDVELLTANGHASRVQAFKKRLTDRWRAAGQHKDHPVSVKDHPDPPFRAVIDRIHYFDYLVISPSSEIVDALSRKPGQPPAFMASEQMSFWSPLMLKLEYLTVYWTTVWADLRALFA